MAGAGWISDRKLLTGSRAGPPAGARRLVLLLLSLAALVGSIVAAPMTATGAPPPAANPSYKFLVFTAGSSGSGPAETTEVISVAIQEE